MALLDECLNMYRVSAQRMAEINEEVLDTMKYFDYLVEDARKQLSSGILSYPPKTPARKKLQRKRISKVNEENAPPPKKKQSMGDDCHNVSVKLVRVDSLEARTSNAKAPTPTKPPRRKVEQRLASRNASQKIAQNLADGRKSDEATELSVMDVRNTKKKIPVLSPEDATEHILKSHDAHVDLGVPIALSPNIHMTCVEKESKNVIQKVKAYEDKVAGIETVKSLQPVMVSANADAESLPFCDRPVHVSSATLTLSQERHAQLHPVRVVCSPLNLTELANRKTNRGTFSVGASSLYQANRMSVSCRMSSAMRIKLNARMRQSHGRLKKRTVQKASQDTFSSQDRTSQCGSEEAENGSQSLSTLGENQSPDVAEVDACSNQYLSSGSSSLEKSGSRSMQLPECSVVASCVSFSSQCDSVISKTPSPPVCPPNKVIRPRPKYSAKTRTPLSAEKVNSPVVRISRFQFHSSADRNGHSKTITPCQRGSSSLQYNPFMTSTNSHNSRMMGRLILTPGDTRFTSSSRLCVDATSQEKALVVKMKEQKAQDKLRKRDEAIRKKAEERKLKLEERLRKAMKAREEKGKQRIDKLRAQNEEARRVAVVAQRKREQDEQEKQQRLAEQQRVQRQRVIEREDEQRRLWETEAEKERELKSQKELKEREKEQKRIARERAEFTRLQREQEQIAKQKEMEKKRMEEEEHCKKREERDAKALAEIITKHNSTLEQHKVVCGKGTETASLNTTVTLESAMKTAADSSSYEITPRRDSSKPAELVDLNNYNIADVKEEDSSDDEECPKKMIPSWAEGHQLKIAAIMQFRSPPIIEEVFPPRELMRSLDLAKIFSKQKSRFLHRTSSAIWTSPVMND